jgi:predicted lipoprotein with Yx(FWY)xxD motif
MATLLVAGCGGSSGTTTDSGSTTAPSIAGGAVLGTNTTSLGTVLVDSKGMTIYTFAADSPGRSNCADACLQYWPAVPAPSTLPTATPGVSATLGAIERTGGFRQLTVDGWPVYTYVGDKSPGMTAGQALNLSGGLWWVFAPSGEQIMTTASASASPSSRNGGGYGY